MAQPRVTLTGLGDGRGVRGRVGEVIELRLRENASTGYRWAFDGLDERVVRASAGDMIVRPRAVGSGGEVRWLLTAAAPATTTVRLKLWRQWEGDRSVQKRFAVK